jgi:hypothetical protein
VTNVGKYLWPRVQIWFSKVREGYSFDLKLGKVNKGRICILMNPRHGVKFVVEYKTLGSNKIQVLRCQGHQKPQEQRLKERSKSNFQTRKKTRVCGSKTKT